MAPLMVLRESQFSQIRTHDLLVTRCVLRSCAGTAAQTVADTTPHDQEVVGSIPIWCYAFYLHIFTVMCP